MNLAVPRARPLASKAPGARRRVIIIAPHFPPSNLAGVHRSRLLAMHLPEFGWEPIILTVHHDFYEEKLDWHLAELVPPALRVERVRALRTRPIRLVGDIGIRGFIPLVLKTLELIDREQPDFLLITVPSFFAAPIGRIVHALRGIPYGIDYIDPWVHVWPGSERLSKHWVVRKLGEILEPIAVRRAALISGVAAGYFEGVLRRNPHLRQTAVTAAMPYGGEEADHLRADELGLEPYLFKDQQAGFRMLYAGAMLPRAYEPLEGVFRAIAAHRDAFADVRIHFVGTGKSPDDHDGYNVRPVAERYGLWDSVVTEHPARIPYLDVLTHLKSADAAFVLGSTEPHYTPSKVYQAVLSQKPVLAVLHSESTAAEVIRSTGAGRVLAFDGANELDLIDKAFVPVFSEFRRYATDFDPRHVDRDAFDDYSARSSARELSAALNLAVRDDGSVRTSPRSADGLDAITTNHAGDAAGVSRP